MTRNQIIAEDLSLTGNTRADKARRRLEMGRRAAYLRDQGLTLRIIATRMGVSESAIGLHVKEWERSGLAAKG